MKSINKLLIAITLLLSVGFANAQNKNNVTETVKINGNCSMCKKTIETAAAKNETAKVNWNPESKTATVNYNSEKTNLLQILKSVAEAGYDNEKFSAPDNVYEQLHGCCQYDREEKPKSVK